MKSPFSRREFLRSTTSAMLISALPDSAKAASGYANRFCFFSKPLPEMNWRQLAHEIKRTGYSGIDLTVRPGGHVKPERAAEDLPKALEAIRAESLEVPMITTALTSAADLTAQPILSTAGRLGIPYFKPGYYKYAYSDIRREQQQAARDFGSLVELAGKCNIQAGFHNHSGYIGGPIWDFVPLMETLDTRWAGYYFDPRHAFAEGGAGAWKSALLHIAPRIKMVAVKDFYWEKTAKGWRIKDCPLGEGMVDWNFVFKTLSQRKFQGPISIHIEYDIQGKTPSEKENNILLAAKRDLEFIKACSSTVQNL